MLYFFCNKFYDSGYIDNNLLIFTLNKNIFHIERNIKRKRKDVNITYLWHCCLDHISESRINKFIKKNYLIYMIMNHWKLVNLVSWIR